MAKPVFEEGKLSLVGLDLEEIPDDLGLLYGDSTVALDLSFNSFSVLQHLDAFKKVIHVVFDNNNLTSPITLPAWPQLETLWINNNKIDDVRQFFEEIQAKCPNITYLSMLKNPACPNELSGREAEDYKRFRLYAIYKLPKLKFLDSAAIKDTERKEAERVGQHLEIARPEARTPTRPAQNPADLPAELPPTLRAPGKTRASFGVSKYVYYGK